MRKTRRNHSPQFKAKVAIDNAAMESWNHSLKAEAIHGERFTTREDAKKQVFEYFRVFSG